MNTIYKVNSIAWVDLAKVVVIAESQDNNHALKRTDYFADFYVAGIDHPFSKLLASLPHDSPMSAAVRTRELIDRVLHDIILQWQKAKGMDSATGIVTTEERRPLAV